MTEGGSGYYYTETLAAFVRKLGSVPRVQNLHGKPTLEHLAWMVEHIASLEVTSIEDAVKAGRWIGWMLLAAEEVHGFWDNAYSRELTRMDVAKGHHLPRANKRV